jgi:rRNA-processing protein FCF1
MQVRSISFDTSFLLKDKPMIDNIIKILVHDRIPCYITSTVVSELEQLKIWGRITNSMYKLAIKRWKRSHATVIDFKNRLLSNAFGRECIVSMEKHHGIKEEDIANDCSILVSVLKNGVDVFLSEDFHFTSAITTDVIDEVTNAACSEYHQMCDSEMYSVDARTFLEAYNNGSIDIDIVHSKMKTIRKKGKILGEYDEFNF